MKKDNEEKEGDLGSERKNEGKKTERKKNEKINLGQVWNTEPWFV